MFSHPCSHYGLFMYWTTPIIKNRRYHVNHMLVFYNKKCKYRLSMKKLYGLNSDEDDLEDDDDSFGDE